MSAHSSALPSWVLSPSLCACVQSCPALSDPLDFSPLGSSVHGIVQARLLKWVAISLLQGIFPTQRPKL